MRSLLAQFLLSEKRSITTTFIIIITFLIIIPHDAHNYREVGGIILSCRQGN